MEAFERDIGSGERNNLRMRIEVFKLNDLFKG